MAQRGGAVHVVTTHRTYKGCEYTAHLLRRSYRDNGKVKNDEIEFGRLLDRNVAWFRQISQICLRKPLMVLPLIGYQ